MGVHNRISENKYNAMKRVTKVPADDHRTMELFGVGASTCRNVRNTENYQEYCERVFRYHGHPNRPKPVMRPAMRKLPEEELEEFKSAIENANNPNSLRMWGGVLLFVMVLLTAIFTIWLVWFAINFLGGA